MLGMTNPVVVDRYGLFRMGNQALRTIVLVTNLTGVQTAGDDAAYGASFDMRMIWPAIVTKLQGALGAWV